MTSNARVLFGIALASVCGCSDGNGPHDTGTTPSDASDITITDVSSDAQPDVATDGTSNADATPDAGNGLCPAPEVPPDGSVELDPVPSNFDTAPLITMGGAIPPLSEDPVGAFRFICTPGHLAYDDPMVFPCEPGRSHLHQFFGNTLTNAYSNYHSLRTSGDSTCENALNRSAYWIPAMMNGRGQVVRPDYVQVYYKRLPETSPQCQISGTACVPVPRGLRFVFDMNPPPTAMPNTPRGDFHCEGPTAEPGVWPDIVSAAPHCPPGNHLAVVIGGPTCWNGRDLDSPDHRSHVAYGSYVQPDGHYACPATHPYIMPTFTIGAFYTTDDTLDRSGTWTEGTTLTWYFSSDMSNDGSMVRPGTSFHSDWWGAWDDDVMHRWHTHCINERLNCSAGEFGDGYQMLRHPGFSWTAEPRVVDPPARP